MIQSMSTGQGTHRDRGAPVRPWCWSLSLASVLTACATAPRAGENQDGQGATFVGAAAAPDDQTSGAGPEAPAAANAGFAGGPGGANAAATASAGSLGGQNRVKSDVAAVPPGASASPTSRGGSPGAAPAGAHAGAPVPSGTAAATPVPAGGVRAFPSRVASVAFEVRVSPPGPGEIGGFVRDRDGKPVARACVELSGAGAGRAPVFTPAEGSFRFVDVPPGLARVTMTVANLETVDDKSIADYHRQDPNLTVMLRPLVLVPAGARVEVLRVKREGDLGQGDGTRWVEVAPLALDLAGYSPACRRALEQPARPRPRSPAKR
jgi:hypothetical protein